MADAAPSPGSFVASSVLTFEEFAEADGAELLVVLLLLEPFGIYDFAWTTWRNLSTNDFVFPCKNTSSCSIIPWRSSDSGRSFRTNARQYFARASGSASHSGARNPVSHCLRSSGLSMIIVGFVTLFTSILFIQSITPWGKLYYCCQLIWQLDSGTPPLDPLKLDYSIYKFHSYFWYFHILWLAT